MKTKFHAPSPIPYQSALAFVLAGFSALHAANLSPVGVTGFNRDIIVENTASGPPFTAAATNFNTGENTAFYQTNLTGKTHGLPLSGFFTNSADGSLFQLQSYTASNALVFSPSTGLTSGTLSLASPATYSRIAVIANSGNGDATGLGNLTLTFNDNTTLVTNYYAPDWFNQSNGVLYSIALQGFERINLGTGAVSGTPGNPRFYQTTINLFALAGATNKPLSSLTFGKPTANSTAIYAVSGFPSSAVTLPAVVNSPAANVLSTSATLAGQVTSTGDEPPFVTIFYGTNNGGLNTAAWSNSVAVGYQSGTFTQNLTGLTPGRTYYFSARAVNAAGTSWAIPAQSFGTPVPTLATITNLPASSITAKTARLNGQVLSSGGDVPAVTLYFGAVDGGTNSANWAQSSPLGTQAGAFNQTVFGLAANTTYFYAAKAINLSGAAWATPSRSFVTTSATLPPAAIFTQHNDNNRSGDNLNEGVLNVASVNTNTFGLLYTRPVDDQIYAQPLIATNVTIPGKGAHNLLIVATVNDTVYAFDADDASATNAYWQTNFLGTFNGTNYVAPANTDMTGACGGNYRDFSGNLGIVGTPVIDPVTKIIYLVARTKETSGFGTVFVQRLFALDLATGTNRLAPVVIAGTFGGITFDPQRNNQRAGLALANGNVYIAWSSHCDWGPYSGWVMAYNAATLAQVAVYCDTPTGSNGGIWMSGQAPAADTNGGIYFSTGNGSVGVTTNRSDPTNRAMSFVKLNGTNLNILSWFTPFNWSTLNAGDYDLGSGGLLLVPGTALVVGGGKSSSTIPANLYVVNRTNLGGLSGSTTADTNIVQSIPVTPTGLGFNHIHGAPVWWDGPDGSFIYVWGESDHLQQYKFDWVNGLFLLPAYARSPTPAWVNGMTGGMLAVSANGTNAGTGILWGAHQFTGDANQNVRPGILHAYDAQNVANELWNSEQYSARDSVGSYAKFVPPTVANGKVYLATFSNRLNVYGALPPGPPVIYRQPATTTRFSGDPFVLSVAPGGTAPLAFQWFKGASSLSGATNVSYTVPSLSFADAGTYSVRITNVFGSLTSSNAVVTVVPKPTISYAELVLADEPIAYWRLDETNGTVARDSWGGHDGQYHNASLGLPGYNPNDPNPAVGFGAVATTDSYMGDIVGIDFATYLNDGAFSIEAWVQGGAQTTDAGIVTYGYGSGGEQFDLDTGNGGRFRFSVRDALNKAHNAGASVGPDNTWQHLVGVCDEPTGFLRLYVNGVQNATATISGGIQLGTSPLSIGSRQGGFGTPFNFNFVGTIDEVAIYDYALSAAQVQSHYLAGINPVVRLYLQRSGPSLSLAWSPGTLQSATNVLGPYTDVPAATAPYPVTPAEARKFYRVRVK